MLLLVESVCRLADPAAAVVTCWQLPAWLLSLSPLPLTAGEFCRCGVDIADCLPVRPLLAVAARCDDRGVDLVVALAAVGLVVGACVDETGI